MSFPLATEACWRCFVCGFLWYIHRQQDPPSLTFARPEQTIKLSLGGSGIVTMFTFQEYHVYNKVLLFAWKIWLCKLTPITLVPYGAYGFSFVLGGWETEQFDLSTNFLILSKFHIRGFVIFSKESLNVPLMVLSCHSNGVWFLTKAYGKSCLLYFILFLKGLCGVQGRDERR